MKSGCQHPDDCSFGRIVDAEIDRQQAEIERLRAALMLTSTYIRGTIIENAVTKEGSLRDTIDAALGHQQNVDTSK